MAAEIDIWRIPVPAAAAASRESRSRWVWPRARAILVRAIGCAPATLRIRRDSGGKPAISSPRGWGMSLSHSGEFSLLALCHGGSLGLDHERLRSVKDCNNLARDLFGENAEGLLRRLPVAAREKAFFSGWVNLEALLKATGEGFVGSRGRFEEAAFKDYVAEDIWRAGQAWRIAALPLGGSYVGAIAYLAQLGRYTPRVREFESGTAGEFERCG